MKYRDEDDKCYGIVGMAIGLTIWNAEELFTKISVDAEGFDCITFTSDYYFAGNPAVSAKVSWQSMLEHYKVTMGIVIANIMCRRMVGDDKSVENAIRKELFEALSQEGKDSCQLERDEIERLFDKSYSYLTQLFAHSQVKSMVHDFADDLKSRRSMNNHEVAEELRLLHMM
ncbi:MAG: hypothetical protein RSA66_10345 [Muribaculaceae bacterium]